MTAIEYCIRVRGYLPSAWSTVLDGMEIRQEPGGDTLLSGLVIDQSALYGLLIKLQNLGITLISINPAVPSRILSPDSHPHQEG